MGVDGLKPTTNGMHTHGVRSAVQRREELARGGRARTSSSTSSLSPQKCRNSAMLMLPSWFCGVAWTCRMRIVAANTRGIQQQDGDHTNLINVVEQVHKLLSSNF